MLIQDLEKLFTTHSLAIHALLVWKYYVKILAHVCVSVSVCVCVWLCVCVPNCLSLTAAESKVKIHQRRLQISHYMTDRMKFTDPPVVLSLKMYSKMAIRT